MKMSNNKSAEQIREIFKSLSEIPFLYSNLDEALTPISKLGKEMFNSHTFVVIIIDPESKVVKKASSTSDNQFFEERIKNDKTIWNEIVASESDKKELNILERYHIKDSYSSPLWSAENKIVGYVYHCSDLTSSLNKHQQDLLKSFAYRTIASIENLTNFKSYNSSQTLNNIHEISQDLLSASPEEFIKILPQKICDYFDVSTCILWVKDAKVNRFTVSDASVNVNFEYRKLELKDNFDEVQKYYQHKEIYYLPNIEKKASKSFLYLDEVRKRRWHSMLSFPLIFKGEMIGILDIFTKNTRQFTEIEKEEFRCIANYATIAFVKAHESQVRADELKDRKRLHKLTEIMLEMLDCNDTEGVLEALLNGALELVSLENKSLINPNALFGEISLLNYSNGRLEIVIRNKNQRTDHLTLNQGITGLALKNLKTINATDVFSSEWKEIYCDFGKNTRSEIATPIFIDQIPIIEQNKPKRTGFKRIGILNIESPITATFSEADEKYLSLLARYAAVLHDKKDAERKVTQLRRKEQQITRLDNEAQIMEEVIRSITDILEFDLVNISLIDFEANTIKTEYIGGTSMTEDFKEKFKNEVCHSLDSNDILASIVKNQVTEVPNIDDLRYEKEVYKKYGHQNYIRVFIPMIEVSKNRVIGILEAGYKRQYIEYIYERDVQILESFVEYVVQALQYKRKGLMDRIAHEFRSPIVGIRSNASFIKRRANFVQDNIEDLNPRLVDNKLDDILTDCEILLIQVAELEYLMGSRVAPGYRMEKSRIFYDVVLKIIKQLRPIVIEHGFSIDKIDYSLINDEMKGLRITTDKIRLNQVLYNLFINSIKYAKEEPGEFGIEINMNYNKIDKKLIVKFKDWGIGIEKKYRDEIFKQGFRCPNAIQNYVSGSGSGLAISKSIMKKLGGDLILMNCALPTEFHIIIPNLEGGYQ